MDLVARERRAGQRGAAIIEMALLLPVMSALFLGVVLFGYDLYKYNRLEQAVHAGARFASIQPYDALHGLDPELTCLNCSFPLDRSTSAFAPRAANMTVYGSRTATGSLLIDGLTCERVRVTLDVRNGVPAFVWIHVTDYPLLTPGGTITLSGKPATVFPYMGNYMMGP